RRQSDFLRFLAQGESIHDACALVGVTRSCYEHRRNRYEEFPQAAVAWQSDPRPARGLGVVSTDCGVSRTVRIRHENPGNPDTPARPLEFSANPDIGNPPSRSPDRRPCSLPAPDFSRDAPMRTGAVTAATQFFVVRVSPSSAKG
ncbi:MAG: hypothetical protein KJZ70_09510, partial [Bryobacterales bacterium]|nr:hypothetical protein [Bryobacterales bacterium]